MAITNTVKQQAVKDALRGHLKEHFYAQDVDWAAKLIIEADTVDNGAAKAMAYLDDVSAPMFTHMINAIVKNEILIAIDAAKKAAV